MTKQHHAVIDMTGKQIGKLTVTDRAFNDYHGQARWGCKCECGGYIIVRGSSLRRGIPNSCGCDIKRPLENVEGLRFGKWTVASRITDRPGYVYAVCCCGKTKAVSLGNLKSGMSKSCGCARRDCK